MNNDESFGTVERDGPRCRLFHRNTNNDLAFQATCLACANEILNCYIRIPDTGEPKLCETIKHRFPNFKEIEPSLAQTIIKNTQAPKHLKLQQRPADKAKSIFECRTTLIQETIKKYIPNENYKRFIREFKDAIQYFQKQFNDLTAVGADDLKNSEATTVTNWALIKGNQRSTETQAIVERNDDLQLYKWRDDNTTFMDESAKKETLEVTLIDNDDFDDFDLLTFVTGAEPFEETLIKEGIAMVLVYKREKEKERGKMKTGFPVWVSPTWVPEPTSSQPSTSRSKKKKKDTEPVHYTATLELKGAALGSANKALYFIPWPMGRCSAHYSKFNKFPTSANYSNVYSPVVQCGICKMHFTIKGESTSTETVSEENKPEAIDAVELARCHGNQRHDICVLCGLGFLIKKFTSPNEERFPKDNDFRGWPSSYCFICTLYRFEHGTRAKLDFGNYKTTKTNYMKLYDKLYDATKDTEYKTESYADDVLQAWNNMHSMTNIVSHKAFEEIARQYKHCQETAEEMRAEHGGRMPKTSLVPKRTVLCVCNSFSPYQFPAHHKAAPKELIKLHGWKPWTNLGIPKSGQQTKETHDRTEDGNVSVSVFDEKDYWITQRAALENEHDGVEFPLVVKPEKIKPIKPKNIKPKNVKKQRERAPDENEDGNESDGADDRADDWADDQADDRADDGEPRRSPDSPPPPGSQLGSPLTWFVELFEQTLEENGIGVRDVEDDYGNPVRVYSQTVNDDTVLWELVPSDEAIEQVFFHDGVKIHPPPVEPPFDEKKWTPARRVWIRKEQNGKKADLTPREVFTESNLSLNPLKSYEEETTKIKIFPTKDTRHAPKLYWWRRAKEGDRKAPKGYMNITTNERVYAPSVGWVPAVLGHLEEDNHNDELKDYSEQRGKEKRSARASEKGSKKKNKSGGSKALLQKMRKHVEHRFKLLEELIKYHSEESEPLTIEIDKTIGTNKARKYLRNRNAQEEHKEFCTLLLKHITDLAKNYGKDVVKLREGGKPDDPDCDWVNFVEVRRNQVKVWGSNSKNHKPADNDPRKDIVGEGQVKGIREAYEERQRTNASTDESNNMAGLFAINTSPTENDEITSDIPWWFPKKLKNKLNQKRKEKASSQKSPVRKEKTPSKKNPVELLKVHVKERFKLLDELLEHQVNNKNNEKFNIEICNKLCFSKATWAHDPEEYDDFVKFTTEQMRNLKKNWADNVQVVYENAKVSFDSANKTNIRVFGTETNDEEPELNKKEGLFSIVTNTDAPEPSVPWWWPLELKRDEDLTEDERKEKQNRKQKTAKEMESRRKKKEMETGDQMKKQAAAEATKKAAEERTQRVEKKKQREGEKQNPPPDTQDSSGPSAPQRRLPNKDQPEMKAAHREVKLQTGKVVSMGYTMIKVLKDDEEDPDKYKKPPNHKVIVLQDYGPEQRKEIIDEVIGQRKSSICKGLANAYYHTADPKQGNYIGELHYELQHGDVMLKQNDNKAFVILKCITSSKIAKSHLLPWNRKPYGYISLICTAPGLGTHLMNEVEKYIRSQRPKIHQIVLCSIIERIEWYARDKLGYVLANANTLEKSSKAQSIVYDAQHEYSKGDYIKSKAPSGEDIELPSEAETRKITKASKVVHKKIIEALHDKWDNRTIRAVIESLCGVEAFDEELPEAVCEGGEGSVVERGSVRKGKHYEEFNADKLLESKTPNAAMTSPVMPTSLRGLTPLMSSSLRGRTQGTTPAATPAAATPAATPAATHLYLFDLERALHRLYTVVDDQLRSGTYNEITLFKIKKDLEGLGLPASIIIRMEIPDAHTPTHERRKDEQFFLIRKRMHLASKQGTAPVLYWHDYMKGYTYEANTEKIYNKKVLMNKMNLSYKALLKNMNPDMYARAFRVIPGPLIEVSIMEAMEESIAEVLTRDGFQRHWRKKKEIATTVNDGASEKAYNEFIQSHAKRLKSNTSVTKYAEQSMKLAPMVAQRLRELVNLFPGYLHACFDTAPRNFVCSGFFDIQKNSLTVRSIDMDNQFCIGFLEISRFKLLMTKEDINHFELIKSWLENYVPSMNDIASPVETRHSAKLPSALPAPTKEELRDAMYVLCLALTASTFFHLIRIHITRGVDIRYPNIFYDFACGQAEMIKKSLFLAWGIMCTLNLTRGFSADTDLTLKCTIPEYNEYFKKVSTKKKLSELLTANHELNKDGIFLNPVEIPDGNDPKKTRTPLLNKIVQEKHKHSRISTEPYETFIAMIELLFARHLVVKRTNVSELK